MTPGLLGDLLITTDGRLCGLERSSILRRMVNRNEKDDSPVVFAGWRSRSSLVASFSITHYRGHRGFAVTVGVKPAALLLNGSDGSIPVSAAEACNLMDTPYDALVDDRYDSQLEK